MRFLVFLTPQVQASGVRLPCPPQPLRPLGASCPSPISAPDPSACPDLPRWEAFPDVQGDSAPPPLGSHSLQEVSSDLTPSDFLPRALIGIPRWGGQCAGRVENTAGRIMNQRNRGATGREGNSCTGLGRNDHVVARSGVTLGLSCSCGTLGAWAGPLGRWQLNGWRWLHISLGEGRRGEPLMWFQSLGIASEDFWSKIEKEVITGENN